MMMELAAHPGPWQDGDPPAFWPVFPITFGLFWLTVLAAGFYLVRRRMSHSAATAKASADPRTGALRILADRFARGEIDEEEYYTRLSVLHQGP